MKNNSKFRSVAGKAAVITVIAAVILTLGIVVTYAFLAGHSKNKVNNDLTADTDPTAAISDSTTDVAVTVTADYATYVRAVIVVNWAEVNGSGELTGNVHSWAPVQGVDYEMTLNLFESIFVPDNLSAEKWTKGTDGFYYYSSPVAANGTTLPLVASYGTLETAHVPESETSGNSYKLNVTIVAQSIQAKGTTDADTYEAGTPAVVEAWGVSTKDDSSAVPTGFLIYKGGDPIGTEKPSVIPFPDDENTAEPTGT